MANKLAFPVILMILVLALSASAQSITDADGRRLPALEVQTRVKLNLVDASGRAVDGVSFSAEPSSVMTVSSSGEAVAIAPGTATVSARARDGVSVSEIVTVVRAARGEGVGRSRLASDREGRLYLSDSTGVYVKSSLGASPKALDVRFESPAAVAVDNRSKGGLYVADGHSVRKVEWNGSSRVLLGDGTAGRITEPVAFERARFNSPQGLAVDSGGNLFIADTGNHAIYYADMVTKTVKLLSGTPGTPGNRDGADALLHSPVAVAVSRDGTFVAVADAGNSAVRLIRRDGTTATVAARFDGVTDVAIDSADNLIVATATGAFLVRLISTPSPVVVSLPQARFATGVTYHRGQIYLMDSSSATVVLVEQGRPAIERIVDASGAALEALPQQGSETVFIIQGSNFAPGSRVSMNAEPLLDTVVLDAGRVQVRQLRPFRTLGRKLLSVDTGAGLALAVTEVRATALELLPSGAIATYAGADYYNGDGAEARSQEVALSLIGIAADAAGNYYIVDLDANCVRRVDAQTGEITTFAGNGRAESSGDGGLAVRAGLYQPADVAIDSGGNVYISELATGRVRRVDARTGVITTVSGNGQVGFSGDGGPATQAAFFFGPVGGGISFDRDDNLYICDTTNQRVRRVDRSGIVTTIAGSGDRGFRGDGGPALQAAFFFPLDVALDSAGNIFISDRLNQRVRRVDARTGIITTYAGNGQTGFSGDGGAATQAALRIITAVGTGAQDQLYVCDTSNNRVRRVDAASNIINTVAGSGTSGFGGDGGAATQAAMRLPTWLDTDLESGFAFVDTQNVRLRRVDTSGNIATVAGSGRPTSIVSADDVAATSSLLQNPRGLAFDRDGSLLIVDTGNHRIRRVTSDGKIQAAIGSGQGFAGDGGMAVGARFEFPTAVALDGNGNYYIADSANHRVRRVLRSTGIINTVAGTGTAGFSGEDVSAVSAMFNNPRGVAIDRAGNLLIADTNNHRLRRVDMVTGRVSTVAGDGRAGFAGDGGAATSASLNAPTSVTVDASGHIFIADTGNDRVRRIDAVTGEITTVAGGDGSLLRPQGVTVDSAGNLIIADTGHHRVVVLEGSELKIIAGSSVAGLEGDAGAAVEALLDSPTGVLADGNGRLFIADSHNNRVRVVLGGAAAQPRSSVTSAIYEQKRLTVSGLGFTPSSRVTVNGNDVTARVQSLSDTQIKLKGSRKKLSLKAGDNRIVVITNGLASNTFVLKL